uniref:Uncharacterized protein n=1 Tax=Anguilla anguilla TaxID=7936 RepID=A0A0E9QTM9_ANGAN
MFLGKLPFDNHYACCFIVSLLLYDSFEIAVHLLFLVSGAFFPLN